MNKRQKKKMAKKMREKTRKPVGIGTAVKKLCDAMKAFNDAMTAYTGKTKGLAEILTHQRAIGKRKKRIAVSGRYR